MWQLIRFKNCGASQEQLLTLYILKIRCLAEFAAPAFHSSLTIEQSNHLEMIQKKSFAIILGANYKNYSNALNILNQVELSTRRIELCTNFAQKCITNSRHADLFHKRRIQSTRRSTKYEEIKCKTARYYNSAVPYMTRLLNKLN